MADIQSGPAPDAAAAASDLEDAPQLRGQARLDQPPLGLGRLETAAPLEQYPARKSAISTVKKLVLFSDGTGNSSAKAEKTNVWRMFQALDLTTSDQMALYDDGVGTSTNKYLAAIGGAFGWGLKRNVIDLYKFVCRNYVDDTTEIYGFGFSRGAFTIRVLMGLITREGLVTITSEEDLHKRATAAYGHFRRACFTPPPLSPVFLYRLGRRVLSSVFRRSSRVGLYRRQPRREVSRIRFLGLWDTVSAYGMPIAELKPAVNWLFWPMNFSDRTLSPKIQRACHALSLDDERTTFHPIVWDETKESDQQRITQVWFAGVHANVGGGYPEDQLSLVSLDWMMQQAQTNGLRLQAGFVERVSSERSSFGKIYDARAGVGAFYRYSPRAIEVPFDKASAPVLPIIHGSVIARMARGADAYVPNSLPAKCLVLAPDGQLLPMDGFPDQATIAYINAAAPATPQTLATGIADERTEALKLAIGELNKPDAGSIDFIRNTIWWRRVAYMASYAVALLIGLYPWLGDSVHAALKSFARATDHPAWAAGFSLVCQKIVSLDSEFGGMVTDLIDSVDGFLPPILDFWVAKIGTYPAQFALLGLLFMLTLRAGNMLRVRLGDYGNLAWHSELRPPYRAALLLSEQQTMKRTGFLLLAFDAIFLAFALTFHDAPDSPIRPLYLAASMLNVIALARIAWHRRFIRILKVPSEAVSPGLATQNFAKALRTSPFAHGFNRAVGEYVAPTLFGIALVYLMAVSANRIAFEVQAAGGSFCQSTIAGAPKVRVGPLTAATSAFSTDSMCWSSGLRLERHTRYRVIVDATKGGWFDRETPTGPRGFAADNFARFMATPLKRWTREPWFAPVARVSVKGNQEYVLQPCRYRRQSGVPGDDSKVLMAEFTTDKAGELFLFVNDAVLALPGQADYFYRNNRGTATVTVEQVREGSDPQHNYYCPR